MNLSTVFKLSILSIALMHMTSSGGVRGELIVTSRFSQHRFDYLYGFGVDTVSGSNNLIDADLLATDVFNTNFIGGNTGFYPPLNSGWDTSVNILMQQNYQLSGASVPGAVSQIDAAGLTQVTAAASGIGEAGAWANNPGNELTLYFTVANEQAFSINGQIASSYTGPGDQGHAYVLLQRFDSFAGWVFGGFYSSFLPNEGLGSWNANGLLTPGDYRLVSGAFDRALGNETFTNSYSYSFSAVPEPSSIFLTSNFAVLMLLRRRRLEKQFHLHGNLQHIRTEKGRME